MNVNAVFNGQLVGYLTGLAVTNPEQVPAAMAEIVQCQVMLMVANFFQSTFEEYISTLEKQINTSWDRLRLGE